MIQKTESGIPIFVSFYERVLIEKCKDGISSSELDPFDLELANQMVSKGVLEVCGDNYDKFRALTLTPLERI